jgi:uncharacterized protein
MFAKQSFYPLGTPIYGILIVVYVLVGTDFMTSVKTSIGTVISSVEGPSSSGFSFIVDENARKGQFVIVETVEGRAVARISSIIKTNRYFERAESVQEFERSGKSLTDMFPTDRWEYLVADAVVLGVYAVNGMLTRSCFPPSPGSKVRLADNDTLFKFFGLDFDGLKLGTVEHHDLDVSLNLTKLLQKHLAVLAISGGGKSYFVSCLLEELLDRKKPGPAVIVIDTHGEYTGFADDPKYSKNVVVVSGRKFRIGVPGLSANYFSEFLSGMSSVQRRELNKFLSMVSTKYRNSPYDIKTILSEIEGSDIKSTTKGILYTLLLDLSTTKLFGSYDNPSLKTLARAGHLTVVDISDMVSQKEKQIVVTYLARKLFNARRAGIIPPFTLVVEEAHNFVPETATREHAISRGIIQTIAREGRKFNASLCLISQRPIQLSTTALSQCNTHIILRVTNPYDLDHIGKSSEGLTKDVLKTISSLRVGEALIVGEAVNYPLFLKVRERKSIPNEKGMPLEKACEEFCKESEQMKKDLEAF